MLTDEQVEAVENLPDAVLGALLGVLPDRGVVSEDHFSDAVAIAENFAEF